MVIFGEQTKNTSKMQDAKMQEAKRISNMNTNIRVHVYSHFCISNCNSNQPAFMVKLLSVGMPTMQIDWIVCASV